MKNKNVKKMMPMLAFVVAIGGAFASSGYYQKKEALAQEWGYYQTNIPCDTRVMCDTNPSDILCTVEHNGEQVQAFGKVSPNATTCSRILYQPLQ